MPGVPLATGLERVMFDKRSRRTTNDIHSADMLHKERDRPQSISEVHVV